MLGFFHWAPSWPFNQQFKILYFSSPLRQNSRQLMFFVLFKYFKNSFCIKHHSLCKGDHVCAGSSLNLTPTRCSAYISFLPLSWLSHIQFMFPLKHEVCVHLIHGGIRSIQHRRCVDSHMIFPTTIMCYTTKAQQMETLKQLSPAILSTMGAVLPAIFALLLYMLSQKCLCVLRFSHVWSLFPCLCNSTTLKFFYTTFSSRFLASHLTLLFLGKVLYLLKNSSIC